MNKIYSFVWNVAQGRRVVAHERAKACGKPAMNPPVVQALAAAVLALVAGTATAGAGCNGGSTTTAFTLSTSVTARCQLDTGGSLTVTPTGTVDTRGTNYGVWVSTGSTSGSIVNNGSILGEARGINTADGSVSGSITNTGTITANGHAISVSTISGDIGNSGYIYGNNTGWSDTAGIVIGGPVGGHILNDTGGTVLGTHYGISVNANSTVSGYVSNAGTIAADGNSGTVAGMAVFQGANIASGITNSGTITGGSSGTFGIWIYGGTQGSGAAATVSNGLTNSNLIYGQSGVKVEANNSHLDGGLVNSGTITGWNFQGIELKNATITGGITNSATGTVTGKDNGIAVWAGGSVVGGIANSGTISGGQYAVYVESGASLDSIHIAGDDTAKFIGEAYAPNTPVTVDSGATYTLDNGNKFTVSSFTNAGTLKIGTGSTATVTGNFVNTGTFRPAVANTGSYGKLVVSGTATLGGTLHVDVAGVNSLAAGNSFASVIHAGAINGTFASVTDNSVLFDFTASYTGTDVNLAVAAGASARQATVTTGNNPGTDAGRVLDQVFADDPSGPISTAFLGITGGTQAVSNAVSQTLPLLTGGSAVAAGSALSGINRVVQARIEGNRGLSSGDDFYGDRKFWMKPFGTWADQADRNGVSGYKARTGGIAFGADATVSDKSRVGLAVAYAGSSVTGNSSVAPNSAKVDLYQLIGYGSYSLDADTEFSYQADIGTNKNHGQRSLLFAGTTATSDYDSFTAHVGAGLGRSYALDAQTSVTPSVRVDYTAIRDEAYTETGAGALNLAVDGRTTEELIYAGDVKLSKKLDEEKTLLANLGLGYDAKAKASSVTAAFAGAPGLSFTTTGMKPEAWLLRGGVGVSSVAKNGLEMTARYDIEHRSGFNNQTLSAKLRWSF